MTNSEGKIQVLIVDDSAVIRGQFSQILEVDEQIEVAATAADGEAALRVLESRHIDVMLLDLQMPVMDGVTTLSHVVRDYPDVKVIIASSLSLPGAEVTMQCLAMGARDFISKPSTRSLGTSVEAIKRDLPNKVKSLGGQVFMQKVRIDSEEPTRTTPNKTVTHVPKILVIGSSTGGPNALHELFSDLSKTIGIPVLIVQHMPPLFTSMLATRITEKTGWPCSEVEDGQRIISGHVYIAPGDYHMTIERDAGGLCLKLNQNDPEHFCRPSINPLFRSAAKIFKGEVLALALTGMGDDGIEGASDIVEAGGSIIAQDEATSVVWGIPGVMVRAGLASKVLPLDQIASRVEYLCGKSK